MTGGSYPFFVCLFSDADTLGSFALAMYIFRRRILLCFIFLAPASARSYTSMPRSFLLISLGTSYSVSVSV